MNDDMLKAAKRAAGVETGPRSTGYVNPKHLLDDEPAEVVGTEPEPPRIGVSTRTKPIPDHHTPAPIPTGGTEPRKVVIDHAAEIRDLVDMAWRRQYG